MDWIQVITIVGTTSGFMFYILNRFETAIKADMNKFEGSMKADMDKFEKRMDSHASRIDQLYRMFVDLLKEKKP
jgi:hypothetical protein